MSDAPPPCGPSSNHERERQRLVGALREVADCLESLPARELPDAMALLPRASGQLFRWAQIVFNRPFGD